MYWEQYFWTNFLREMSWSLWNLTIIYVSISYRSSTPCLDTTLSIDSTQPYTTYWHFNYSTCLPIDLLLLCPLRAICLIEDSRLKLWEHLQKMLWPQTYLHPMILGGKLLNDQFWTERIADVWRFTTTKFDETAIDLMISGGLRNQACIHEYPSLAEWVILVGLIMTQEKII